MHKRVQVYWNPSIMKQRWRGQRTQFKQDMFRVIMCQSSRAVAKAMSQHRWKKLREQNVQGRKALNMPAITSKRPKYYTPNEVNIHNTLKDLWVSFLGKVYDLTPMCEKHAGK